MMKANEIKNTVEIYRTSLSLSIVKKSFQIHLAQQKRRNVAIVAHTVVENSVWWPGSGGVEQRLGRLQLHIVRLWSNWLWQEFLSCWLWWKQRYAFHFITLHFAHYIIKYIMKHFKRPILKLQGLCRSSATLYSSRSARRNQMEKLSLRQDWYYKNPNN